MKTYRMQVLTRGRWVWGIKDYSSMEQAEARLVELKAVGIKARIRDINLLLK